MAAWLGHRTYASLCTHDLNVLNGSCKYVIIDSQGAIDRAHGIGFDVTGDQWREVEMTLSPSGISGGLWLIDMHTMGSAARLTFEDEHHEDVVAIWQAIGMADGRRTLSTDPHVAENEIPEELRYTVQGEIRAFNEGESLAVPVDAQVLFKRLGLRLYGEGELLSVRQTGIPCVYEPDEEVFEFYYMSED
ncbi:hypothetical protein DBR37_12780 [Herminiimonas sp. KBW02]|nr:hypothetical protein DBR37_12780 [Herminiimonas sp. KBW02]